MGHSHSKNNEKDSAPAYIPDFEVMRMIESHNYGRAKLVCDTKTGTHMILREFLFDNKQVFEKEVKSFEEKGAFEHPNIIQIVGYYTTEANNFCSRFFKVSVFIEEPHESLENKIKERVKSGLRYSDEEILTVADNLVSALSHLQQTKDLSHGDIRPANIYVSGQNYKITDPKLEVDQNANMLVKAMINGSKAYLSPALLKQVPTGAFELTEDKHKADVFALGATLLYMATLKDNEELYSYETGEFYEGVLHHRLHHVQHYYSPFTYDLIRDMLEVDEHHRPCLNDLREKLAGFSGEHHHHHHHDCNSKGWEQGRFRFVGEAGDDQKLVSWKYKQEARLGYEQRVKEGNLRKKMEEEELEHARRREKEHQEMHKKMKEQHKEIIKKSHEEKEHALKSFAAPHTHEEDHHVHEHQHLTLSSHVTTPHITQPSSYTPTHSHQHIHFDHAFLSARSTKKDEEERELARKRQEEHDEFMRRMEHGLRGFEQKKAHEEHALKSARVSQVQKQDHHIHEFTQVQPQQQHLAQSSHLAIQPISTVPIQKHQDIHLSNASVSGQATKWEEEERELARKQEEYREFMRKIDEQLGGLEKTREHGAKEHVVKSARVPQIHEDDHHIQAHKKIEEITQVQPQHHVAISSHVIPHITQPISAATTHNHHHMDWDNTPSFNQANAQPTYFGVANIYSSANIHSPVESPVRTSHYQGNYSGAVDRNSVKTEHSVEENIASYNYALGGSPLRQRNTRSTKFSIQQDELNHSFGTNESPLQGHNLLEDLKQFNLSSQSQTYTPSHGQNFQAASLNGHMATSIHAPGRNIY